MGTLIFGSHVHTASRAEDIDTATLIHAPTPDMKGTVPFATVSKLSVLGCMMDEHGCTVKSMESRLAIASRTVFKDLSNWCCMSNWAEKLKAWRREIQPIGMQRVGRWELALLRTIHGLR